MEGNASRIYAFERTFSVKPLISYISKSDQSFILSLFYFPSAEAVTMWAVVSWMSVAQSRCNPIVELSLLSILFLGVHSRQPCHCMHLLTGQRRTKAQGFSNSSRDGFPFPSVSA